MQTLETRKTLLSSKGNLIRLPPFVQDDETKVMNIRSKYTVYILPLLLILLFAGTASALPTVAHERVSGEMYVSSTANWDSMNSTNNFDVPNGTVVFARYYVGVWASSAPSYISTTFNGHAFETNPSYYVSGMGVTWIPYNVTDYVQPGETNTATIDSSHWGDGRQYGSTLVVVLENESKPEVEYWIAEGLDWSNNYGNTITYFNDTNLDLDDIASASLYSTILTGYSSESLNGEALSGAADSVSGGYFDYKRWDNIKNSLTADNQTVKVVGDDSYTSVVLHGLSITYKTPDLVPTSLTPSYVTQNTVNTMTATIENTEDKDSPAFNVSLIADGTVVDTQPVSGLAAGSNTTVDLQWTPDSGKDSYSLTVVADPDNSVVESDETNNELTVLVGSASVETPVANFTAVPTSGSIPLTVDFTDQSTNSPTSWFWDFGDGENSTSQTPSHTYTSVGNYTVSLTATNAGGSDSEVKTDYITVEVITPVAAFTADNTSGATPFTVQFTDQSANLPAEWLWDFGDGANSTEQNPTHTYTTAGKYTVKLTAANAAGNDSEEKTDYITAYIPPVANFTATPTSGSAPLTIVFTDQSSNSPTEWLWDFGDGSTSTSQTPTHTYSTLGSYTAKLTATNVAGTSTTTKTGYITVTLAVGPVWTAKSEWNIYIGSYIVPCFADLDGDGDCDLLLGEKSGISYAYENTGTKNSPVWAAKSEWNVPDIETTNDYAAPCFADLDGDGDYDLLIGVKSGISYAYENTGTKNNPVWTGKSEWNAPDVGYYAAPYLADLDGDGDYDLLIGEYYGTLYSYENAGTKNSPVWTVKTEWNVPYTGSSGRPTTRPVIADLDDDGDYDLLIGEYEGFTSGYENTGTKNNSVWTRKPAWYAPDIGLNAKPATADLDGDGDYDLLIGSQSGISYAYENTAPLPGSSPDLTPTNVTLPSGVYTGIPCTVNATINNTGTVNVGSFTASLSVNGTVMDTQTASEIAAGSSTSVSFSWTPEAEGDYSLTVTADPENGIDESDETNNAMTVTVTASAASESPIANFTSDVTSGNAPLTVNFTDQSTGAPTSWFWDFGDGVNSTEQNPIHTYTAEGNYSVKLTVTNAGGSDEELKTDYITVLESSTPEPEPVAAFTAEVTNGDAPLKVNFIDQSTGSPTSWLWDFGDGANSTEQNPVHTYASAGSYTVNLTVENAAGTDFELKTDYIEVSDASGSNVTLYFDPASSSVSENESTQINLVASNFPAGLSGYNLTVAIDNPAVADIVDIEYPSWASITENSSLPGTSIYLKTVDGEDSVKEGATDVVLATLTVSGKESGSANLSIGVKRLEDDSGNTIEATLLTGKIEVALFSPLPDQEYAPRDLDGDGIYEDLTGNGEFSFVDIVAYFHNMDWIEENMPVEYFDFNGNGRIDFDDIVDMFAMI